MIKVIEKNKKTNIKSSINLNSRIKKITRTYLELGLISGYIDEKGKTVLSKEDFDDWD